MNRAVLVAAIGLLAILAGSVGVAETRPQPLAVGESLRGRFVQERHLKGFASPLRTEGRFVLAEGRGLIWRGEKPFETATVITPSGVLQTAGGTEQARISAARAPFLGRLYDMLAGALSGDLGALSRDFDVVSSADADRWRLMLRPRQAEIASAAQMESIAVEGGAFVEKVEIRKPGGDRDQLVFIDQSRNRAPLPPEDSALFDAAAR